jgi:hypothetical protein
MPKYNPLPPLERLNELLEVVEIPEDKYGEWSGLVRKVSRGGQRAGSEAGCLVRTARGVSRWKVMVDNQRYYASRLIYFMINGVDPDKLDVDHKDRNPLNNNIENLRLGNGSLQGHNRRIPIHNTSGAVGVSWYEPTRKWQAYLTHEHSRKNLGYFICKIEAARAYNSKVIELGLDKLGKPLNDLETLECDCKKKT